MSFLKAVFRKTGHLFLSIIRFLRRTLFCRRKRRESGMLLPLTVNYASPEKENTDFHDWNSWGENEQTMSTVSSCETEHRFQNNADNFNKQNNLEEDDFFKDMVPQIRKPKKIIVKNMQENVENSAPSNRLAMDPRAFSIQAGELGVMDDNLKWGETEYVDEDWDAESLIKEKRMADREKRIAEHQRRKLEKESKQAAKLAPANSSLTNNLFISEDDKTKYS